MYKNSDLLGIYLIPWRLFPYMSIDFALGNFICLSVGYLLVCSGILHWEGGILGQLGFCLMKLSLFISLFFSTFCPKYKMSFLPRANWSVYSRNISKQLCIFIFSLFVLSVSIFHKLEHTSPILYGIPPF